MKMFDNYNEILTVEELMKLLWIGKNKAYELLQSRQINAFRIGKVWKIPRKSVEEYAVARMDET
jgi:excisionase family DNA binding protein